MRWINNFDLFLFDFDGLLVNTEHIHFQAYVQMLKNRGLILDWSFEKFCSIAHLSLEGIKNEIYLKFPELFQLEPRWEVLYEEKKKCYLELLKSSKIELMPGVESLMLTLKEYGKVSCGVTNSSIEHVRLIIGNNFILKNVSHWIAREDYLKPKPDGECYSKAIELFGKKARRIIGFEDTLKGINALLQTKAKCVIICPSHHPQMNILMERGVFHFESFLEIPETFSFS